MRVSVVMPVLNEAGQVRESLDLLQAHGPDEVIVVDGGSTDGTLEQVGAGVCVLRSPRGRATQMNRGAAVATGDVILFLHADTRLPPGALAAVRQTAPGGRFRLRFDRPHPLLAFYAGFTRWSLCSFGDAAFFVRREVFQALGGFSETVPFEDVEFWRRLRRFGPVVLPLTVTTSARRFVRRGAVRQMAVNLALAAWAGLGGRVSRRWYPEVR
ncbi:MAG TPA: TIGR04283 family arsenosugar biosynthesis glycosyltransferase [Candidatus Xenobia bacterium]|jgi:rSAM/selenodomain-associated transferase 2